MELLFWVVTILLALAALVGYWYPTVRDGSTRAAFVFIVIDLVLLGLRAFGAPR